MSGPPSWIPPQAPTYTSNCAALSEDELVELVARTIEPAIVGGMFMARIAAGAAISALQKAGAMK